MLTNENLNDFSALMNDEYHVTLDDFLASANLTDQEVLLKVGRLVGVLLKEPFAEKIEGDPVVSYTGAYNRWEIKPEYSFDSGGFEQNVNSNEKLTKLWQYGVLDSMKQEMGFPSVGYLVYEAHYERGFFSYLSLSISKYICGNKEIKKAVEAAKKEAGISQRLTPEAILGSTGTIIAAELIKEVSWLSVAAAPIITGLVIIIGTIGIDAYCKWSEQYHQSKIEENN
jgi:hypothetical protein